MKILKYVLSICCLAAFGFFYNTEKTNVEDLEEEAVSLVVHAQGAVKKEGDYTFPEIVTVEKALDTIGVLGNGLAVCANPRRDISHDMILYVPFAKENLVPLNSATLEELCAIKGIGPKKAEAIISARPFTCIEDILKIKGIGMKSYQKFRESLCL